MESTPIQTKIPNLGQAKIPSPVPNCTRGSANSISFVTDDEKVLIDVRAHTLTQQIQNGQTPDSFERAGPRDNIFLTPVNCAVLW
jgi:6-phosphofructokinase 1